MSSDEKKHHVAVLPFPFTSHPMALAKHVLRLAAAAPKVHFSFLNIPSSNNLIFPPHSKHDLPPNLKIYDIAAPSGQTLEEEGESYYDTAPRSYEAVMEAAAEEIRVPVSFLITDFLTASASDTARKMGVKWIAFWVAAPFSLLAQVHTHAIIDHLRLFHQESDGFDVEREMRNKKKIDFVPGLSAMRVEDLPDLLLESGRGNKAAIARTLAEVGSVLPNAAAVVLNCFEEENLIEAASVLRSKVKTLLQIGYPDLFTPLDSDQSGCLPWLDRQNPKSVVYVGFGTMLLLPPDEILAIAEALEERKSPYIWSLKDHQIHLPPGFVKRTRSYGKVVPWAPQTLVLSHPSVGAHLTLAGHNSMVESIMGEVPMICRPVWADNMMNTRMMEEVWLIGVGVEGRIITKNGLVKCLEMVLGDGEKGKRMREKIKALKEVMVEASTAPNGSAIKDFNSLVELISTI